MHTFSNIGDHEKADRLKKPISKLAHMMAKITLRFNFLVHEFIELYKFHLVTLASQQNPKHSIVEISARTGLDRRYVSDTIKNEALKKTSSKILLVLTQIRQVCTNNQSKLIDKRGSDSSFDHICQQVTSSSLTCGSIATELIRLGEIIDQGQHYEIINLNNTPVENSIIYFYEIKKILSEIRRVCDHNYTKYLTKTGEGNSFENICHMFQSGIFSANQIAEDLVSREFIIDLGSNYQLLEQTYIVNNNDSTEHMVLLSNELEKLTDTIIFNSDTPNPQKKSFQRNVYSTQINPEKHFQLKIEITRILKTVNIEIGKLLEKNEADVPKNSYPSFGVSLYIFDYFNPNISSRPS